MDIKLLAHTQLSEGFIDKLSYEVDSIMMDADTTHGQVVALSAIRTCYSANKPSEIVTIEGEKYFKGKATDGKGGNEVDRLIRHIVGSGHTSTLEHLTYTFSVEGVSRALLAQLTRHRVGFSFSVQSQRYVRFGSDDKSGGFDYVVPEKVDDSDTSAEKLYVFEKLMQDIQNGYDRLRELGVPAEDARSVLPNAATTNLVLTVNLRSLLDFYSKRRKGKGAQHEITELAERLREEVVKVEPWTDEFFKN
ncbi:FAD-dependent thymidylate synthase [Bacillus cereus]|uniref:FAD-dependent thymidylate synthase n=1 Tax=Bacillus cereus TaxID=1396 RepID=UPI000BEC6A5D|nr:FAD-dependent thymidylate synthase [Bacillus cereus]PDY76938.1 thymidylate synthase (FAD) [Bacillus cereus]